MPKRILAHQYFFIHPWVWLQLLWQNKGVAFHQIPRAFVISMLSIIAFPFTIANEIIFQLKKRKLAPTDDPIFIIGHWRTGTTYLHYLLAKDRRFSYLTYYQAFLPNLCFLGGSFLKKTLTKFIPSKRPQDNMELEADLPTEEENPLSTFSIHSASHSFFFPKNEKYYYNNCLNISNTKNNLAHWKKAYQSNLDKIRAFFGNKQLLIKNPHNTGRVEELLILYPNAKFIYLHRPPKETLASTFLMYDKVVSTQFLQKFNRAELIDKIIHYHDSIIAKYKHSKTAITSKNLFEISYSNLIEDPMSVLIKIYDQFDMELKPNCKKEMQEYILSKKNYKKNTLHSDSPIFKVYQERVK